MQDKYIEAVYDTLNGFSTGKDAVPGVENAFAAGSYCTQLYDEVYKLKLSLFERLNSADDEEVERIVMNLLDIQHELCVKMFCIGAKHQN